MSKSGRIQRIQKAIDQSLIICMLIHPSSFTTLSQFFTPSFSEYQKKNVEILSNIFLFSLLNKISSLTLTDLNECGNSFNGDEEENEIFTIIQEDDLERLKLKFLNHCLDLNHQDRKGIRLIERCVLFNSKQCLSFLLEENASIDRHKICYKNIGLMEYGALKGNRNIVNLCLEKGQKIKTLTIQLGLIAHQNELVEWMIEEGKKRHFFSDTFETQIFGIADNIEFNEKLLENGMDINAKDDNKI